MNVVLATPGSIQLANSQSGDSSTSSVLQYSQNQDGNMFVPVSIGSGNGVGEDQTRKREIRLLKNREAARECRRKKKEYIKCLENRVAVLENQNKALIEELKSLKELYCQQKSDWELPEESGITSQQEQLEQVDDVVGENIDNDNIININYVTVEPSTSNTNDNDNSSNLQQETIYIFLYSKEVDNNDNVNVLNTND